MRDYKALAKSAKALGLLKSDGWDLRSPLSRGQKSYLTKLDNKLHAVLTSPQDYFIRRVKSQTAREIKKAEAAPVINNRIIVQKHGATKLQIKRRGKDVDIIRRSKSRTDRQRINADPFKLLRRLEKMKPLKPGQAVTVKFGEKAMNRLFDNPQELARYLSRFNEKDISYMTIVKFRVGDDLEEI